MIPEAKALKLIAIYLYICKSYNEELQYVCQKYSNNDKPDFTDQEIMTLYLFTVREEQCFSVSQVYSFANNYLSSWFPALPSYKAFNKRLNHLSEAFKAVVAHSFLTFIPPKCELDISLLDSTPNYYRIFGK